MSSSVPWIVPTLAGVFLAASLLLLFVGWLNYLVDTYLLYAASAIAANTIARSACGSSAPLFTNQMFHALGVGGGGSLIGGVATLLAFIPFLFSRYGKQIRIRSKFAPTNLTQAERVKDEEAPPTDYFSQDEEGESSDSGTVTASDSSGAEDDEQSEKRAETGVLQPPSLENRREPDQIQK